jgi:hypothetical protein
LPEKGYYKKKLPALLIMTSCCHAAVAQKDSAKKSEPNIKQFWLVLQKTLPNEKAITD